MNRATVIEHELHRQPVSHLPNNHYPNLHENKNNATTAHIHVRTRLHFFSLNAASKCDDNQQRNSLCVHITNIYLTPSSITTQYFHGYVPYLTIDMGHLCRRENPTSGKGGSNLSSFKEYQKIDDSLLYFYFCLFVLILSESAFCRRVFDVAPRSASCWHRFGHSCLQIFLSIDREDNFLVFFSSSSSTPVKTYVRREK